MGKYDLWRDVPNDLWILKDKQGNILKKADCIEKIKNFVKMKQKIEDNKNEKLDLKDGELAYSMDGKVYIFDEPFYQTYKSTKEVESLIDDLIPSLFPKSLDLANTLKSINKRLEDKYPHYLKRYLIEKGV